MTKITKQKAKLHYEAMKLVELERKLTLEEKWFIVENYEPNASNLTISYGVYFTPKEIAHEFAIFSNPNGVVIDLCAGIGMLSFMIYQYDSCVHYEEVSKLICVERNEEFVKVGKRVLPEAEWICGSVFDKNIISKLPYADCVISNPPFGRVKVDDDVSWLKYYSKKSFEASVISVSIEISNAGCFIVPFGKSYYDIRESQPRQQCKEFSEVSDIHNIIIHPSSWDLEGIEGWNYANPDVEFVSIERKYEEYLDTKTIKQLQLL